MKEIYFLLFAIPFITACHSLSIQKSKKSEKTFSTVIDHSYFQSQADWHYIKGEQASARGFYQLAIESFKQALVYKPHSFSLHFRLLDEYLKRGLYLQAIKQCDTLLKNKPDNLAALRLRKGEIYEKMKLYKKAHREYDQVLRKKPDHLKSLYQKANLHIQTKEFLSARSLLTTLIHLDEKNIPKIHYLLAQVDMETGQIKQALSHFKKAMRLQPDFAAPALALSSFYQKTNQTGKAINVLEELQNNIGFSSRLSLALFYFHTQQKNKEKALGYLQPFLEAHSKNWWVPIQLAWTWGQKQEYDKAIPVIEKILSMHPQGSSQIYILYAQFLEKIKNFSKTMEVLLRASRIFPRDTQVLFYIGFIYDRLGQADQAIKWMKKVLALDTNHVEALNHLAFIYAEQNKNLASAERMIVKALSFSPNDSYILDTAGWIFFKRGKTEQALEYLKRAYKNNPSIGMIAEHLAEVYYHLNMLDKSIALYKKAIGLETNEHKRKTLEKKLLSLQLEAYTNPV
ncbi:MAG: tetratricopeptide repeat protein [Bdellovibrionales bacterium]|nr:tetratricopeptide repeat protein [Bdellovibrionales bacterium]